MEKALDAFITPELLDGENKVSCSKCKKRTSAVKGFKFIQFSDIITLHLKRFTYSQVSWSRIKISKKVSFPLLLDVKPWLQTVRDSNKMEESKRASSNSEKKEGGEEKVGISKLKQKFLEEEQHIYELFSVMIHAGGCFGGEI